MFTNLYLFLYFFNYLLMNYVYNLSNKKSKKSGNKMKQKQTDNKSYKTWWHILLCDICGVFFILFPLALFAAILDYHPEDPSFNKVISGNTEIKNFLGSFGAFGADFVLSTFGLAFIIFLIVPVFWGVNLLFRNSFWEWKTRLFAWFVGLLCAACFIDLTCCNFLGGFNLPYNLTGQWSRSLSTPLNSHINAINLTYYAVLVKTMILFISLLAFNFAAGITFRFWWNFLRKIVEICNKLLGYIFKLCRRIVNIRSFNEFKEKNPGYLQHKIQNRLISLQTRHEPEFTRLEPSIGQTVKTAVDISQKFNSNSNSVHSSGPEIIINNTANENLKKQTVNPTFDFIDDSEPQNQSKIEPEEIYHAEGMKKAEYKKSTVENQSYAVQQELLTMPTKASSTINQTLKTQHAANSNSTQITQPEAILKTTAKTQNDIYTLPSVELLTKPKENNAIEIDENALKENAAKLEQVLNDFGIRGQIVAVRPGPVVTLYELEPKAGTRTARVIGLSDDIARSMAVPSVRMAVVSGHSTIGIELPNEKRQTVWIRDLFEDKEFMNNKNILNVALGKDIGGQHVYADISKMPHLLVAGTTGSGKSVGVNTMILSLLYRMTPEQCKFIMIDPKQLEFSMYNGIPHLLTPVITDPAKAVVGLKWAVQEMEKRYRQMALLNVRNIAGYNKKVEEMRKNGKEIKKTIQTGFDRETGQPIYEEQILDTSPMPYIVIVVDEMADLMLVAGKEVEAAIQRLAQMARAAGIHLIMSTQRPSVDVITGVIKSNFPSRISFHVTTKIDSGTILGEKGAEQLLGMGDMLFMSSGLRPVRVHGCYVADDEVERVVEFIKSQGEPQYVSEVTAGELNTKDQGPVFDKGEFGGENDEENLYRQAVDIVRADKKASTSYVQRKLRIGYNRAANLIERMEQEGIVTKQDHVGRREVIGAD